MNSKTVVNNQIEPTKSSVVTVTQSPEIVVKKIAETRDNINLMNGILKENGNKLSESEVERTKQMLQKDISQYNNDIKLLSLLVGKQISSSDISKLASTNLGRVNAVRSASAITESVTAASTTVLRTTQAFATTVPVFKPLTDKETQFLDALEQIQTTKTSTSTTTQRTMTVSKSQEAIIAALLRQQGIGPNNQIPIEVS